MLGMAEGDKYSEEEVRAISDAWPALQLHEGFSECAAYAKRVFGRPFSYYLKRISALGTGGRRALDIGSGVGQWSLALASWFDEVQGVDITPVRVDAANWISAQLGVRRVSFREGEALPLRERRDSYDFVFCYSVILSKLSLRGCLNEFYRVLLPGGQIYVSLNGPGWTKYLRDDRGSRNPKDRIAGCNGFYNSLCQKHLGQLSDSFGDIRMKLRTERTLLMDYVAIAGGDYDSAKRALEETTIAMRLRNSSQLEGGALAFCGSLAGGDRSPMAGIAALERFAAAWNSRVPLEATAREIAKECGQGYIQVFASDIVSIFAGGRFKFSHDGGGRDYDPGEVASAVACAGFVDFEFADEGLLRVGSPPADMAPIYPRNAGEPMKVWDFMARKPR